MAVNYESWDVLDNPDKYQGLNTDHPQSVNYNSWNELHDQWTELNTQVDNKNNWLIFVGIVACILGFLLAVYLVFPNMLRG